MRKPSRTPASATAALMLAAAMPAAAAPMTVSPTTANLPIPCLSHAMSRSAPDPAPPVCRPVPRWEPDPVCAETRQPAQGALLDWWRRWWAAATSRTRQTGPERPARAPFYLRSPMLSGFIGWGEPSSCIEERPARQKIPAPHAPAILPENRDTDSTVIGPAPHHG